jgi:hypothetical protein
MDSRLGLEGVRKWWQLSGPCSKSEKTWRGPDGNLQGGTFRSTLNSSSKRIDGLNLERPPGIRSDFDFLYLFRMREEGRVESSRMSTPEVCLLN